MKNEKGKHENHHGNIEKIMEDYVMNNIILKEKTEQLRNLQKIRNKDFLKYFDALSFHFEIQNMIILNLLHQITHFCDTTEQPINSS